MIDAADIVTELLPALNAQSTADLVWWSEQDLYNFADETVKKLARTVGVFGVDSSPTFTSGENAMPAGAIVAVHVAASGSILRPATVRELEALDAGWQTAAGEPKRWVQDLGLGQLRLYPAPAAPVAGLMIYHAEPAAISTGATQIAGMPGSASGYLSWAILSRARSQEGEAQMPDVAAHFNERCALWEAVAGAYWGPTA